jgi:hypothetical protein
VRVRGSRDHGNEHAKGTKRDRGATRRPGVRARFHLELQGEDTAFLGAAAIDSAKFHTLRLVIDPSKSNVVLKNGKVLTDSSTPPVKFFSRRRHGILVDLDNDMDVRPGATTTITLDFRLGDSIFLRGASIGDDGLVIRAVVRGHCH